MARSSGLATLAVTFACGCASAPPEPAASAPHPMLGKPVEFSLPSDEGALVRVPQPGAQLTVLDFFAPTCAPCREKVPALHGKRADLASKNARLILVAVLADGETSNDAARTLATWGVRAPFLVDHADVSRREAGVTGLPTTLILDRRGVVRWSAPPSATAAEVVASLPKD